MKTYLSDKQAVAMLSNVVSAKLNYLLIAQGRLTANRALGKILIEEESLLRLMEPTPAAPEMQAPARRPPGRPKRMSVELW